MERRRATVTCLKCRSKKIKCDVSVSHPCSSCKKHGFECIRFEKDRRKERHDSKYIESLEEQVKLQKDVFTQLQRHCTEITRLISEKTVTPSTVPNLTEDKEDRNALYPWTESFPQYKNQSLAVYGPTSIFDSVSIPNSEMDEVDQLKHLNSNSEILECIKLFFRWLYPDMHYFLYREAFLLDFFHPKIDFSYCSKELVFAICSIGSLLSENEQIRQKSKTFYDRARQSLLNKFDHPTITSLQSFLILGLYDIYNGRNNGGWMLTGTGLRMGFNLGFQLSPKSYHPEANEEANETNIGIRSRVLWGSYVVDHFISLILGRPSVLKMSQATMEESNTMPDLYWIKEFTYTDPQKAGDTPKRIDIANPLKATIGLINITEGMLQDIFTGSGLKEQSFQLSDKLALLEKYNRQLVQWKECLPSEISWKTEQLLEEGTDPTKMGLKYYYYIVVLCLNRPFISHREKCPQSVSICKSAIDDLYMAVMTFTGLHGYSRCSILIIYSCILSVSVILLSSGKNVAKYLEENHGAGAQFFDFMDVLCKSGKTWKLAEKSYTMIRSRLLNDYSYDYDLGYAAHVQASLPQPTPMSQTPRGPNPLDSTFGGPPLYMTSEDIDIWGSLFPDYDLEGSLDPLIKK
ncbi:hypothetical protein KL941_002961 [Ogataea angusta]|nr:hypothetical protein KL941_002961 [Ogataea angusta]